MDMHHVSALELGARLRAGEFSARELVEATLRRIEALEPAINAFTIVDGDQALAVADTITADDERPLAGVPIAVKDLTSVAGWPLSGGSQFLQGVVPEHDSNAVRSLRDAGCVIVGLTNTPEFGILAVTEPRRFGPTRNPWDTERSPGGSSGGSAAAVAAGMVPLALGSDGGGSIRVPAACCGLVGLKPSRGRISRGPDAGDSYLATDGVLTRNALDSAMALDLLAGYRVGDASWAAPPAEPFLAATTRPSSSLRIALTVEPPFATAVDPINVEAVHTAAGLLTELGHTVAEATPPWAGDALREPFTVLWCAMVAGGVRGAAEMAGREPAPDELEPLTWELERRGAALSAVDYQRALQALAAHARTVVSFFARYDVLLTPALGTRPPRIGEIDAGGPDPMAAFAAGWALNPFCPLWNATGQPAISLPVAHGADGLPAGVQLVGRPLADDVLLGLARELEQATSWETRRPALASTVS